MRVGNGHTKGRRRQNSKVRKAKRNRRHGHRVRRVSASKHKSTKQQRGVGPKAKS